MLLSCNKMVVPASTGKGKQIKEKNKEVILKNKEKN